MKTALAFLILVVAAVTPLLCSNALKFELQADPKGTVLGLACWAFVALVCAIALANSALHDARAVAYKQGQQDAIRPENLCRLQREQANREQAARPADLALQPEQA